MKTYFIDCPYFINGHKNVDGMAIADSINKKICDQGLSPDESAVTTLLDHYITADDIDLYQLIIVAQEHE